jgi:beta-N-acetylhexosaminidase
MATPPPGGLVTEADIAEATARVAGMSVEQRAGMVIMAGPADAIDTTLVQDLELGGVILMGSGGDVDGTPGGTPTQVAAVTAALQEQVPAGQSGAPLLIGVDQEYGIVTRLANGFTDFPGAQELGDIADTAVAVQQTEAVTAAAGRELAAVGVTVNFAPVADVAPTSGDSGVAGRMFGSDPGRTGQLVAASVRGYQSGGVAATLKHFPGIGRLSQDTHVELPTYSSSCAEWNATEAVPMQAGIDAGAALVMTGHILLPAVGAESDPSSVSAAVVTDLLRGAGRDGCVGLGFQGVAVSDSLVMAPIVENYGAAAAAWRALAAGQDLALIPQDPVAARDDIVAAVASGELAADRLQQAAVRVLALRLATGRTQRPPLDVVGSDAHAAIAAEARAAG